MMEKDELVNADDPTTTKERYAALLARARDRYSVPAVGGVCPECKGSDGYVNVGEDHYSLCDQDQTYWYIGSNLFSSWEYETQADWDESAAKLSGRREVEPVFPDGD